MIRDVVYKYIELQDIVDFYTKKGWTEDAEKYAIQLEELKKENPLNEEEQAVFDDFLQNPEKYYVDEEESNEPTLHEIDDGYDYDPYTDTYHYRGYKDEIARAWEDSGMTWADFI